MRPARHIVGLCALVTACANTASHTPNSARVSDTTARKELLAVLPFAGHPGLRRGAGEWFAHKMEMLPRYRVIAPGTTEMQLASETDVGERAIDVEEAKRLGALLGAQLVVLGNVKLNEYALIAEVEVTLIDVSNGELLRRNSSPRGMEVAFRGPYPATVSAVEEVAQLLIADIQTGDARERAATPTMKQ